ncbi:MAG TPA: nitrous oxide-stimulated promoter family protein [Verrucomicrobiae bacterium]|nr:nitrous oxide-stimulated promoter family protein [Verrucomicrobiae bacterium]
MNATVTTAKPVTTAKFTNRRLAREWETVTAMLHIYCREQHGGSLCPECEELKRYVSLRLDRCRFGEEKPTCAKCPVHCYQRDRREQIKAVMRFSGPRMVWEHPWLSLHHLLDGWFRPATPLPASAKQDKFQ